MTLAYGSATGLAVKLSISPISGKTMTIDVCVFFCGRSGYIVLKCGYQGVTRDVRPVGDYILAFKSCCVELVSISPFPGEEGQAHGTDPAFHRFHLAPSELFSDASLSEPQPSPDSASNSLIVYALACGTCFGCFYFRITIHDPNYVPSGPRAKVDIDLLGFYRLEEYSWLYGTLLGPEGKRGFWIQRAPSSRQEILVTVSFDQSRPETMELQSGDDFEEICEAAPPMEPGVSTWVLGPWDKGGEYTTRMSTLPQKV